MAKQPRRRSSTKAPASRLDSTLSKLGPEGRADLARAVRQDSFKNAATGMGIATRDKREFTQFEVDILTMENLEDLYRAEDVSARIVDALVESAFRQGFEVVIEGDEDRSQSEDIMARLDEMNVAQLLEEAAKFGRALGGAALLVGADDGRDSEEPIDFEGIKSFSWLTMFTPRELTVERYYEDVDHPLFGKPEMYRTCNIVGKSRDTLAGTGKLVHESRLIRFDGQSVSNRVLRKQRGWADSVLLRPYKVIRDFNIGWSAVSVMLNEFSQAILKIKGLSEIIAENGETDIAKRAAAMNVSRSVAGVLLLDSEEEFSREVISLAGVPETLKEMLSRLAMAARMPVTILAGISPGGLNATGESDITQWYDTVKAWQGKTLLPALNTIVRLAFLDPAGPTSGKEPENWSIQFNPLWQLTEKEQVELRGKQAQTDTAYINAGVLLPEEVAIARFGGDRYSSETKLDMEARAEAEKMAKAEAEAAAPGEVPGEEAPGKAPGAPQGAPGENPRAKVLPIKPKAKADGWEDVKRNEKGQFEAGSGGVLKGSKDFERAQKLIKENKPLPDRLKVTPEEDAELKRQMAKAVESLGLKEAPDDDEDPYVKKLNEMGLIPLDDESAKLAPYLKRKKKDAAEAEDPEPEGDADDVVIEPLGGLDADDGAVDLTQIPEDDDDVSDDDLAELGLTRDEVPELKKDAAERTIRFDSADRFDKAGWELVERNEKGQFMAKSVDDVLAQALKDEGATPAGIAATLATSTAEEKKAHLLHLAKEQGIKLDPKKVAKLTDGPAKPALPSTESAKSEKPGKPASDFEMAKLAIKAGKPLPPGLQLSPAQKAVISKAMAKAGGKPIAEVTPETEALAEAAPAATASSYEAAKEAIKAGKPLPSGLVLTPAQKAVLSKLLKQSAVAQAASQATNSSEDENKAALWAQHDEKVKAAKELLKSKDVSVPAGVDEDALKTAATFIKEGALPEEVDEWLQHLSTGEVDAAEEVKQTIEFSLEEGTASVSSDEPVTVATKSPSTDVPIPAPPMPDASGKPIAPTKVSGWKQTGPQAGSNPGGVFESPDGGKFYVKFRSPEHAKNEVLASKLYEAAGVPAPQLELVELDGKVGVASKMMEGKVGQGDLGSIPGVHEGFAADAWLGNWDAVGLTSDNILVGKDGIGRRIDLGGSLLYRAQGKEKGSAFGHTVGELESLKDQFKNPSGSKAFGGISEDKVAEGAERIAAIPDETIKALVQKYGPGDGATKQALAVKLIDRKRDLVKKAVTEEFQVKKALAPEQQKAHAELKDIAPEHATKYLQAAKDGASGYELESIVAKGHKAAEDSKKLIGKQGFVSVESDYQKQTAKALSQTATAVQSKEEFAKSLGYNFVSMTPGQKAALSKKFNSLADSSGSATVAAKGSQEYANIKAEIAEAAAQNNSKKWVSTVDKLGGDGKQALHMIASWKGSSQSDGALELRAAVAHALGEKGHDVAKLLATDKAGYKAAHWSANDAEYDKHAAKAKQHVKTLKAMAKQAQALHPEKEVVAYRGIQGKQAAAVRQAIAKAKADGKKTVRVAMGLLASWSESKSVASGQFAGSGGVVLKAKVPTTAIAASHRASTSQVLIKKEQELVIMSAGYIEFPLEDIQLK